MNHPTELHGPRCHVLQGVRVVPPRTLELHFGGAGDLLLPMGDDAIAHVRRSRRVAEDRYVDLDDGRHFFAHDLTHGWSCSTDPRKATPAVPHRTRPSQDFRSVQAA
ncbi:MAG: hypothetical protein R3B99_24740 [Polyangiales bacterium]